MNVENSIDSGIIDNLKKATTELIILSLLKKESSHIVALTEKIEIYSNGELKITFPYAAIYRLINSGYIYESGKKIEDGRRRQFLSITEDGVVYLSHIRKQYESFTKGIDCIFKKLEETVEE